MFVSLMYDSCGPNTTMFPSSTIALTEANGLVTSAFRNFMLHFSPSRTNSSVGSPSTHVGLPVAAANLTVFAAFVLVSHFFRISPTFLAAFESTVISKISCTPRHLRSPPQPSVHFRLDAPIRIRRPTCRLHVFRFEILTNPSKPLRCPSRL